MSCGEDVSGDEIVFVLEQADEREAGQCDPGCLQVAGEAGALAAAGFEAAKAVDNRVKKMISLSDDGTRLMGVAFKDDQPFLVLADLTTQTGKEIQSGYRFLFMDSQQAIRNPSAHEQFAEMDDDEAFELLGLASLLMRRLDEVIGPNGRTVSDPNRSHHSQGIIGTGFAYVPNYQIITSEGATVASTVTCLLPVDAIVLGILVLGESVTVIVLAGAALVLAV